MENKLHTFEKSLDKLNLVDVNNFSKTDFKSVNKDIETQLNNFKEKVLFLKIYIYISTTILFESGDGHKFNLNKILAIIVAIAIAYFI